MTDSPLSAMEAAARSRPPGHRHELLCVQALRGFAVLMVLVVHVEDMSHRIPGFGTLSMLYTRRIGYSAPDMFFVLSGFIMSYITFGMPFHPRQWLVGRFVRIYPMYFAATFCALLIWLARPGHPVMGAGPLDGARVLWSFTMLPQPGLPLLFVGWTVEHEIVFYFIVFLVAAAQQVRLLTAVLGTLSVLAVLRWAWVEYGDGPEFWDMELLSPYMAEFFFGAMIYQFRDGARRLAVVPAFLLSLGFLVLGACFATAEAIDHETPLRVLLFGLCYALLLVGLLNREERLRGQGGLEGARRPFLVRLGDASYSMYLCHPFVLAMFGHAAVLLGVAGLLAWLWLPAAYLAVIGVGLLLYATVEKPSITLMRRWLGRRTAELGRARVEKVG